MYSKYHSLTKIYESVNSIVYRSQPVILKEDYPIPEELTRYRQEYDITRSLSNLHGVINAYEINKYHL